MGLESRLRMMCEDPEISPHMRLPWPGVGPKPVAGHPLPQPVKPELDGDCKNLYESVGWWEKVHEAMCPIPRRPDELITRFESFGANDRNIVISLNVDGFLPSKRGGRTLTPFMCMVLNLPENLRHRDDFLIFAGLIPGPNKPTNLNPYLRFLVKELNRLWRYGFTYVDPVDHQTYTSKVKLLFTCMDYPGHSQANCMHGHGAYYACQKCDLKVRRLGC